MMRDELINQPLAASRQLLTTTVVICHYNPTLHPYLQHLVCLCVAALQKIADEGLEVLVCDGSPTPDPFVQERLGLFEQVRYVHAGTQLSFGATYNLGIQQAQSDYVVLLANDVLISSLQIRKLVRELRGNVACAIPYLTRADYATQVGRRTAVPRRSFPASMTINVNAFRRELLQSVGNVPEELTGCYNDAIIFHRLRQKGYRVSLVNVGEVDHLRAITRRISTNLAFERDLAIAPTLAPDLFRGVDTKRQKNFWARIYANSAQYPLPAIFWRGLSLLPWKVNEHRGVGNWVAQMEPYVSCSWKEVVGSKRER